MTLQSIGTMDETQTRSGVQLPVAALAYYSFATTAYALLWNYALGNSSLKQIQGDVDSPEEYLIVFALMGLTLTMVDALFSTVQLVAGGEARLDIMPQPLFNNETLQQLPTLFRTLGSAGVYLATFLFATRPRYVAVGEHTLSRPETDAGDFYAQGRAIPYILAATVTVLGAVLSQPVKINKKKKYPFLSLTPHKTSNGMYAS